jgi:hypothetical protein
VYRNRHNKIYQIVVYGAGGRTAVHRGIERVVPHLDWWDEALANALLIAAAPDLLAALEAILPMTGAPHDYTIGDVWKAQDQARAAIAKTRAEELRQ